MTPRPRPRPELLLCSSQPIAGSHPSLWRWRRSLLDAEPYETAFTVDPARFAAIAVTHARATAVYDYDGDDGDTIRFGDGDFGETPDAQDVVPRHLPRRPRRGRQRRGRRDHAGRPGRSAAGPVPSPTPSRPTGGARRGAAASRCGGWRPRRSGPGSSAPCAAEDYEAAAETLPWVHQAGTHFRWTGSWLTVFTTRDPRAASRSRRPSTCELIDLLNRCRLAGYESYAPDPRYVALDLIVTVCAQADAFRGDVEAAVLAALAAGPTADGSTGSSRPTVSRFGHAARAQRAGGGDPGGVTASPAWCRSLYRRRGCSAIIARCRTPSRSAATRSCAWTTTRAGPSAARCSVIVEGGK